MKSIKYSVLLIVVLSLSASASNAAGSLIFLGSGSVEFFQDLGQAAALSPIIGASCVYTTTLPPSTGAKDLRVPAPFSFEPLIAFPFWVAWQPGTGTCGAPAGNWSVYAYVQIQSVVGVKCFFANPSCIFDLSNIGNVFPPDTFPSLLHGVSDFGIPPAAVQTLLLDASFNAAGTVIRPEDAKFATFRMFSTCGSEITRAPMYQDPNIGAPASNQFQYVQGLGYQGGMAHLGKVLSSFYGKNQGNLIDFNISGTDPITGRPVTTFAVTPVGAQPIVVAVNPSRAQGFGDPLITDLTRDVLARYLDGGLGRTDDAYAQNSGFPVSPFATTVLIREPLSGTYNVLEYSIPNSIGSQTSQDAGNCSGTVVNTNPLHLASTNGVVATAFRNRVITTGEMTSEIQAVSDSLGYFFWSTDNTAKFTEFNGKYLTVDGIDPIQEAYSDGVIPTAGNFLLGNVSFANLKKGAYPIWSTLRLVTAQTGGGLAGAQALTAAAQSRISPTQPDFVPFAQLQVLHSHFTITSIGVNAASNGNTIDICIGGVALVETGGDAGGKVYTKQANQDYCSDFHTTTGANGLINKIQ